MATTHQPVILMRAGAANDRLADVLRGDGIQAWRWPAFTITLPEDEAPVAQRFANQIQTEYAGLHNLAVGMALRADGHGDHRRIGIDHARPCDGDQIVLVKAFLRAAAGDDDGGNGG